MVMRILLALLFAVLASEVFLYTHDPWTEDDVVEILSVTNGGKWGDWHEPKFCPRGSFAVAYRMKIEGNQLGGDDTALNAIRLSCWSKNEVFFEELTTAEGPWGDLYDWGYCPMVNDATTFAFLTAFILKVESDQGGLDDTAANDVQFLCGTFASFQVFTKAGHNGEGQFGSYGDWSVSCPVGSAICGLRTKIEKEQGDGDDTALNDVQFYCCRSPQFPLIGK